MIKKYLFIEGNNNKPISDVELKKKVTKALKGKKITPKNSVNMYFNTTEWKVYVVVDNNINLEIEVEKN